MMEEGNLYALKPTKGFSELAVIFLESTKLVINKYCNNELCKIL
jgi:hypothetical protein